MGSWYPQWLARRLAVANQGEGKQCSENVECFLFPSFCFAVFPISFQISTSVLAIDMTATPTRCAPTLRVRIIAFVKKATSVTDFNARKKANKRKDQNRDAQVKKKKTGRYWQFPCLLLSWHWMFWPLKKRYIGHCDSCTKRIVSTRLDCLKQALRYSQVSFGQHL